MSNRNNEDVEHSGIRGMKWGFHDGRRNGKRTARAKEYSKLRSDAMNYAIGEYYDIKYHSDKRIDDVRRNHAEIALNNAKGWGKAARDASGLGYNLGYNLGQAARKAPGVASRTVKDISKSVSKGAAEVSKAANKTYNSITKSASSGLSWLKKHFF